MRIRVGRNVDADARLGRARRASARLSVAIVGLSVHLERAAPRPTLGTRPPPIGRVWAKGETHGTHGAGGVQRSKMVRVLYPRPAKLPGARSLCWRHIRCVLPTDARVVHYHIRVRFRPGGQIPVGPHIKHVVLEVGCNGHNLQWNRPLPVDVRLMCLGSGEAGPSPTSRACC